MGTPKSRWPEEIIQEHLPYETDMLEATHSRLDAKIDDHVLRNALIESFCIHARALIDFFNNRNGAKASTFTEPSYLATHAAVLQDEFREVLNEQVAHLSDRRPKYANRKIEKQDRERMLKGLEAEKAAFLRHLRPEYKALWAQKAHGPTQASATNVINTSSTTTVFRAIVTYSMPGPTRQPNEPSGE